MPDSRPPLAKMESREPKSIRFTPDEWTAISEAARLRALEPAVFVRRLAMYALSIVQAQRVAEASAGVLGMPLESQRTSPRF